MKRTMPSKFFKTPLFSFLFFAVLVYLVLFRLTFPPCSEWDVIRDIPPHLQGATVKFQSGNAVLRQYSNKPYFGLRCTPIGKQEAGYILYEYPNFLVDIKQGKVPNIRYVAPEEGLKLHTIITRKCSIFHSSCFENGTKYLYLILEDKEGKLWRLRASSKYPRLKLIYYQNGQRQGELNLQNYFSRKDGLSTPR